MNALKAAYAEPAIKRFVLTSSSSAVLPADTDTYMQPVVVTEDSWSEDAVKLAWAPPPYAPERGLAVYAASKVESEQAVWKYHKEHQLTRPDLTVNTGMFTSFLKVMGLTLGSSPQPKFRKESRCEKSGTSLEFGNATHSLAGNPGP